MSIRHGKLDKVILLTIVAIALLGIFFVYSATFERGKAPGAVSDLVLKQCMWVAVGFLLLIFIANMDYARILDFAYLIYFITLLLLVFTLIFAGERYGAKRWIDLGLFSLQPSEFVKLAVIFSLAAFLGSRRERVGTFSNFMLAGVLVMPAFLLIFMQPDLGTALVLVPILFAILYVCGENVKYLVTSLVLGIVSLPIFWHVLKDYQKARLMVFINPNIDPLGAGYTIIQSKIAIGSGGLLGKGWLNGTQSHLRFLPEKHTDFIFSVVGEEWGLVGGLLLVALYGVIIARGIRIIEETKDVCGKAIATGVVTLMAFQVIVNVSMTMGLMPVVGIPLPLISYGGSNAIATLIGVGFLLSVSRRSGL